jgi:hypothetical protein
MLLHCQPVSGRPASVLRPVLACKADRLQPGPQCQKDLCDVLPPASAAIALEAWLVSHISLLHETTSKLQVPRIQVLGFSDPAFRRRTPICPWQQY